MSEKETKEQGQRPKISILAIGKIAAVVIVFLWMIAILWPGLIRLREYRRRIRCGENIERLGKSMLISACYCDDKYPTPDKWCDLLVKYAEVTEKEFVCPSAGEGRCHYAMNPNAKLTSPPDMVVLFETKGGWNQFGGPEILTFENHKGKGCNVLFNDLHVRFVKKEQLSELKWDAEEKQNSDSWNFRRPANDEELKYWLRNMGKCRRRSCFCWNWPNFASQQAG